MNDDWENEEVLDINSPCLPDGLRQHGKRFKNPARYVIELGDDSYILYAEDGELLDMVYFKQGK